MFGTVKRLPNCTVVVQKMKKKKTLLVVAVHSRLQSGLSEELSEPGDRWGKGDGGHDPPQILADQLGISQPMGGRG